jgi:hypothetical protein
MDPLIRLAAFIYFLFIVERAMAEILQGDSRGNSYRAYYILQITGAL